MLKKFHVLLLSAFYFHHLRPTAVEAWVGLEVQQVEEGEFPFSVALIALSKSRHVGAQYFCGGTLITQKHVLTSAHCLQDRILPFLKVLIGSHSLSSSWMKYHDISHYWTYESWAASRNLINSVRDIAVLTLKLPTHKEPITLSPMKAEYLVGKRVGMASWGLSDNDIVPDIMEKAYAAILSTKDCLTRASKYSQLLRDSISRYHIMCNAGNPNILGTCGNSGSPVFDENTKQLVGIHKGVCRYVNLLDDQLDANLVVTIDSCRSFIRDATQQ